MCQGDDKGTGEELHGYRQVNDPEDGYAHPSRESKVNREFRKGFEITFEDVLGEDNRDDLTRDDLLCADHGGETDVNERYSYPG